MKEIVELGEGRAVPRRDVLKGALAAAGLTTAATVLPGRQQAAFASAVLSKKGLAAEAPANVIYPTYLPSDGLLTNFVRGSLQSNTANVLSVLSAASTAGAVNISVPVTAEIVSRSLQTIGNPTILEIGDDVTIGTSIVNGARVARWIVANLHSGRVSVDVISESEFAGYLVSKRGNVSSSRVSTVPSSQTNLDFPELGRRPTVAQVTGAVSAGDVLIFKGSGDAPGQNATTIYLTYLGATYPVQD
jgi:hypothetical protein